MKDLAIAIEVGSPNSTIQLVQRTFESIRNNIGNCDWKVFIMLGLNISKELDEFVNSYVKLYPRNFEIFGKAEVSWAEFINTAIELSSDYEYFTKSHDDIELLTPEFFPKVLEKVKAIKQEVGWISFHDLSWKQGNFSPSTRDGFHKDVFEDNSWHTRQIFQFHLFPPFWTRASYPAHIAYYGVRRIGRMLKLPDLPYPKPVKKISKYTLDLPTAPVICHAPFNHFVMIKRSVLDKIGKCEEWNTFNALYVDEDWGLRCLEQNIPNIWIPDIDYIHSRGKYEGGGTRSWNTITRDSERVGRLFYHKWGFNPAPAKEEINTIRQMHTKNMIPWSSYRKSWEWDYI
jgi:hypothetical protein